MQGTELLRLQLTGSCALIADGARAAAAVWDQRAFAEASRPGFVLWHCARIVDWGVNAVVREAGEAAEQEAWRERIRYDLGHGAGLTGEQADEVARTVTPEAVATYAEALGEEIGLWLDAVADDDLDRPVELRAANARNPLYATPAAWSEVASLDGIPAWQLLARPCVAHIRVHMGEVDVLRQALARGSVTPR